MDTSPTYILQCQKATEIQAGKLSAEVGDYFSLCRHPKCERPDRKGILIVSDREWPIHHGGDTWLPHQDQLQEMMNLPLHNLCWSFEEFMRSHVWKEQFEGKSMEQLWLAFVMAEKYSKRWTGSDWE